MFDDKAAADRCSNFTLSNYQRALQASSSDLILREYPITKTRGVMIFIQQQPPLNAVYMCIGGTRAGGAQLGRFTAGTTQEARLRFINAVFKNVEGSGALC